MEIVVDFLGFQIFLLFCGGGKKNTQTLPLCCSEGQRRKYSRLILSLFLAPERHAPDFEEIVENRREITLSTEEGKRNRTGVELCVWKLIN